MSGQTQRITLAAASASPLLRAVGWGLPALMLVVTLLPDKQATPLSQGLLTTLALGILVWFQLAPRRLAYTLTPDAVVIQRILAQTRLPYAGLRARRTDGVLGTRTFGTGLPGYLTGHFTLNNDKKSVKQVLAAASTTHGGVLLHSGDAHYFLTPADPKCFLTELSRRGAKVKI
ncbi:PH domain-containing protein [Deinococcus arenicola]|uniref:PH domain-containing protein n=1 Tax=Deinococcus arenicola TaxID=2994950 RepID=A0ABU4DQJ0_9DEIO|nr:PH domain-containing protein [Deinococcus sp. ZS9-10]MDV6374694.1 PH domain-containing protein [Deinococcus sp. ZS9-10]